MQKPRLGIAYKNFASWKGISHIGLGVAAYANCEYIKEHTDFDAVVLPVRHNIDIVKAIKDYALETGHNLTHVVISAPWISTRDIKAIVEHFPLIQFAIVSHSNVGFLQADPSGIHLLRDYIELALKHDNLTIGGNSKRFCDWVSEAYDTYAVLLPNMYPIHKDIIGSLIRHFKHHDRDVIKIGSFGAIRPLKNQLTACASAIIIAKRLKKRVEFHLSAGREEGGGNIVLNAIQQMSRDVPNFELVLDGWAPWLEFRKVVADMDLLIHPSYTESFNMVSADGISQNVPVVGSTAIHWLPPDWQADSDDAVGMAEVGIRLLSDGASEGVKALKHHNERGLKSWKVFLES